MIVYPQFNHISMIASVTSDWGIGKDGHLLYDILEDKKFFKNKTEFHTVVMGYNTAMSLPNQRALPNRRNIVLTKEHFRDINSWYSRGFIPCDNMIRLMDLINPYDTFIIGGSKLYEQFLPNADFIYLYHIYAKPPADAFFPDLHPLLDSGEFETSVKYVGNSVMDRMTGTVVYGRPITYVRTREHENDSSEES